MCGAPYVDLGDLVDRGAMYIYYNVPVILPPGGIAITGAAQGLTGITYPFTAVVSPDNTALPLTFTWQATGHDPVTHIVDGLSDTVAYTWTEPGAKSLTVTATNSAGQVVGTHLMDLYLGVAHVEAVEMQYKIYHADQYMVIANVQVHDQVDSLIPDAAVSVLWTLPDGSNLEEVALSMKTGWARFKVKSGMAGEYKICVTEISLLDWLYDESQNEVTCATLQVP
mgnify:CR=1 FL=1